MKAGQWDNVRALYACVNPKLIQLPDNEEGRHQ